MENIVLVPWRTFSIFISSTFVDMQAERDHLKNFVFPKVEDELQKRRIKLEVVDLRWGVDTNSIKEEDKREAEVLKVCIDEIKRCRPFFIGLLGDRYGWVPPEERMKNAVAGEGFLLSGKDKSVTALEIEFGVLASQRQLMRSVFYFREYLPYNKFSPELAGKYCDEYDTKLSDDEKIIRKEALKNLKENISAHFKNKGLTEKVKSYNGKWDTTNQSIVGLESWGDAVYQDILKEFESHATDTWDQAPQNWQEQEVALLDAFIERHTHVTIRETSEGKQEIKTFSGREKLLEELKLHLLSNDNSQWGLVLTGESGSGKSAVFSMMCKTMRTEDCLVLEHAAGLSPRAKSVASILQIWNKQLADFLGIEDEQSMETEWSKDFVAHFDDSDFKAPVTGIEKLQEQFKERLWSASQKKRVLILIDALDQFESSSRAEHMSWLPTEMPSNIRMLCTAITNTEQKAIQYHKKIVSKSIDHFTETEAALMLENLCLKEHKKLPLEIKHSILGKKREDDKLSVSSPLWLSLAVNILMAMDGDDFEKISNNVSEDKNAMLHYMKQMAIDFPSLPGPLFIDLVKKAGKVFGNEFTNSVFEFIAISRNGLREKDFSALIPEWDALMFANLRRWFKTHLILQGENLQWNLGHSILIKSINNNLEKEKEDGIHESIANHLLKLSDDSLKSSEVMYHLLKSNNLNLSAHYYGSGDLSREEVSGATAVLAKLILENENGIEIANALPTLVLIDDTSFLELVNKYIFNLYSALTLESNIINSQKLLENLQNEISKKFGDKLPNLKFGYNKSVLYSNLGLIYDKIGQIDQSLELLLKCNALSEYLFITNQNNDFLKKGLGVSYNRLGNIYKTIGKYKDALEFFEKNLKIDLELLASNPEDKDLNYGLAMCYLNLGIIQMALGSFIKSLDYFERSQHLLFELFKIKPNNEFIKNWIAFSFSKLGDIQKAFGNLDVAIENYEKSKSYWEELFASNPNDKELKLSLAISYCNLGDIQHERGDLQKAEEYFKKYFQLAIELYTSDTNNEDFKNRLGISYGRLGTINERLNQLNIAEEYFKKCHQIAIEQYNLNPQSEGLKNGLAISYFKLGSINIKLSNFEKALDCFEMQNKLSKELYAFNPLNESLKEGLAVSYFELGETNQLLGKLDNVIENFEMSLQIIIEINNSNPNNNLLKNRLKLTYNKIGIYQNNLGSTKKAIEYFEKGLKITRELNALNPSDNETQKDVILSFENLGDMYNVTGNKDKSMEYYKKFNEFSVESYNSNPTDISLLDSVILSYFKLGAIYIDTGNEEEGNKYLVEFANNSNQLYNASKIYKYKQWLEMVKTKFGIEPKNIEDSESNDNNNEKKIKIADDLFKIGKWKESLEIYSELIVKNIPIDNLHYKLAVCLVKGNQNLSSTDRKIIESLILKLKENGKILEANEIELIINKRG